MSTASRFIVIGSGPAALSAVLYSHALNFNPLYYCYNNKDYLKDWHIKTLLPWSSKPITAFNAINKLYAHVKSLGVEIVYNLNPIQIITNGDKISIESESWQQLASTIIIATTEDTKWTILYNFDNFKSKHDNLLNICHFSDYFNKKTVCILADDNLDERDVASMASTCKHVHLICPEHNNDGTPYTKKWNEIHNLSIYNNSSIENLIEISSGNKFKLKHVKYCVKIVSNDGAFTILCDESIIKLAGRSANTHQFKGVIPMDRDGYIFTRQGSTHSLVNGIFAAGGASTSHCRHLLSDLETGYKAVSDAKKWMATQLSLHTELQTSEHAR